MTLAVSPISVPAKRRIPWVRATIVALGVVLVVGLILALKGSGGEGTVAGQYYHVVPMDLDIVINKDGELAAVNNVDISNPVEGQSTILELAKEGDFVHKGDVVCRLDGSDIQKRIETAQLDVQKSEADVVSAKEQKEIQESSNAANLEAAQVELTLAQLDLQEYVEGKYKSDLQDAKVAVEMAQIEVKNKEDDLAQTRSLFSKGFVTAVDVKTSEIALLKAKNELEQKTTALDVLEKYTHEKELTDRRNKVAQAEKKLARTQKENASNLAQKVAAWQQSTQSLTLRQQQLDKLTTQLDACTMKAPADGMVVYASSSSMNFRYRDTPISPGAQIRQQEPIIRLPDTSSMKAVARINEAQVSRLRVDPNNPMRATVTIVGQPQVYTGWLSNISIMADSSQRWMNPDTKEYPVDITLDKTPQGLKPGVSAQVRLFVDRLRNVLAVPIGCVYAAGPDNYVFSRNGGMPKPVKVAIGQVNDTHAQVVSGIGAGDEVLILQAGQGRELLEKAGIKVQPTNATTQPFDEKAMPPGARPGGAPGAIVPGGPQTGSVQPAGGDGAARQPRGDRPPRNRPNDGNSTRGGAVSTTRPAGASAIVQ